MNDYKTGQRCIWLQKIGCNVLCFPLGHCVRLCSFLAAEWAIHVGKAGTADGNAELVQMNH